MLARVRRANEGMLTIPTASMALNDPGPRMAMMTMARRIAGTARRKSSTRMIPASVSPPAKPPRRPRGTPTVDAHEHRDGAGEERDPRAVDHAAQDVAAELVRAEGMGEGWRQEPVGPDLGQGIMGRDPGGEGSHDRQQGQDDTRGEPGGVPPRAPGDERPCPAAIYMGGRGAGKTAAETACPGRLAGRRNSPA